MPISMRRQDIAGNEKNKDAGSNILKLGLKLGSGRPIILIFMEKRLNYKCFQGL